MSPTSAYQPPSSPSPNPSSLPSSPIWSLLPKPPIFYNFYLCPRSVGWVLCCGFRSFFVIAMKYYSMFVTFDTHIQANTHIYKNTQRDGLQTIIVKLTSDFIQASNLSSKCHHLHALICFLSCVKEHLCRDESLPFVIVHLSVFVANLFSSIFFKKYFFHRSWSYLFLVFCCV